MQSDIIYFRIRSDYDTIYGKADLSKPKTEDDGIGDSYVVYPTDEVVFQEDRAYYEEGDNTTEPLTDGWLKSIENTNKPAYCRITKEEYDTALAVAAEWITKYESVKELYEKIKATFL